MAFAGYLKQSIAVDILIGPFIDDLDGRTAETGLALDIEVSKNGQALANKSDVTVPTHDSAGDVEGYYNCELDTTDTGTLGILTIVAHASGFLPIRLDYQIVTANWFDTMCSTDQLDVNVTNIAAAAANKIADHIWRRTFANIRASSDGDSPTFRSGLGLMGKFVNRLYRSGANLLITQENDTTTFGTQAMTTDSGADPITELDTT